MPRRSWRDLAPDTGPDAPGAAPPQPPSADGDLLRRAAAADPHLAALLGERAQLEARLDALTGAGGSRHDPRYPVTALAERRAEIARWAEARDRRPHRGRWTEGEGLRRAAPGSLTEAGRGLRSQLFGPLRSGLNRFDQVRSALADSDELLERPRQLADGLERRWERAEERITGPLDRVGRYAETRDRVLDLEAGGSGDLTARAENARRRLLEARSALHREERLAEQRHTRHHDRRRAAAQETERLDRRGAARRED